MKIMRLLAPLLAVVALAGCAHVSTQPDQVAVAYSDGPIEGNHYDKVVGPSSGMVWLGVSDKSYVYPTTVRDYTASSNTADREGPEINAPTKEGVNTAWELVVYFKINTTKIKAFHENVGLKFEAHTDEGWVKMLNTTFRNPLENTVQRVARTHTADEIYKDASVFGRLNHEIADGLKDQINTQLGADYFCGPTFTGGIEENKDGTPCPDLQVQVKRVIVTNGDVVSSYEGQKKAENDKVIAEQNGQKRIIEAERGRDAANIDADAKAQAQAKLNGIYQDPRYIEYLKAEALKQCAGNSNCTLIISQNSDGSVNVNVGK